MVWCAVLSMCGLLFSLHHFFLYWYLFVYGFLKTLLKFSYEFLHSKNTPLNSFLDLPNKKLLSYSSFNCVGSKFINGTLTLRKSFADDGCVLFHMTMYTYINTSCWWEWDQILVLFCVSFNLMPKNDNLMFVKKKIIAEKNQNMSFTIYLLLHKVRQGI